MPFLPSGSCSFVRFGVNATRPRNFNTDHLDLLRLHPGIRSGDAELGWAAGDHVLDADFTEMKQIWPDHPYVTPEEAGWCPNDAVPDFLGNEFLLWLWFTGDIDTDTIKLPDDSDLTFMFSGGVKVEDPRSISGRGTLNSDSAVRLPEAKVAVKHGKLPRQAALTFVRHDEQFGLILQAESLAVTSCKLPKPPEDIVEHRARLEHRLQALHDLAETIDLLFAAFLNVRLSPMWPMHLSNIQGWLKRAGQRSAA